MIAVSAYFVYPIFFQSNNSTGNSTELGGNASNNSAANLSTVVLEGNDLVGQNSPRVDADSNQLADNPTASNSSGNSTHYVVPSSGGGSGHSDGSPGGSSPPPLPSEEDTNTSDEDGPPPLPT